MDLLSSRTRHLEKMLATLGMSDALRALDIVITEMSAEQGYARHDGSHYYYHLVDVTQLLLNFGIRDENVIIGALLHDYIEDVPGITKKYVAMLFNDDVAEIVDCVSKKQGIDYKNNDAEMRYYLNRIENNVGAALVKTADRMHNFSTLGDSTIQHKQKQVDNTLTYFIPFFKNCRKRYVRYSSFFFEAKTRIEPIAREIESYLEMIDQKNHEIEKLKNQIDIMSDEIYGLHQQINGC